MREIKDKNGMALVSVLIFSVVAIIAVTLGVSLMAIQSRSSIKYSSSQEALILAESAMENALIRLLRNPEYLGENLTFEDGTATITVTGTTNKSVLVVAETSISIRKIEVTLEEQDGVTSIISWREIE